MNDQRREDVARAIRMVLPTTGISGYQHLVYEMADAALAALAAIDDAEVTDAEELLKAADAVIESFHAYGQEKGSPLVIWRVDPIAMRHLIIAARKART